MQSCKYDTLVRRYKLEQRFVVHCLLARPSIGVKVFKHPRITHLSEASGCCRATIQTFSKDAEQLVTILVIATECFLELYWYLLLSGNVSIDVSHFDIERHNANLVSGVA